jgi:hypothetical protein
LGHAPLVIPVDTLLARATAREPVRTGDAKSGSVFGDDAELRRWEGRVAEAVRRQRLSLPGAPR